MELERTSKIDRDYGFGFQGVHERISSLEQEIKQLKELQATAESRPQDKPEEEPKVADSPVKEPSTQASASSAAEATQKPSN